MLWLLVGNRREPMVDALADLGEGVAFEVEFDGLRAVAKGPTGVLLLRAKRYDQALLLERFEIPADRAQATVEDAEGQVFGGQERALIEGFLGHAVDLSLP